MRVLIGVLLMSGCMAGSASGSDLAWLETEQFDDHGGWTNDSQFIDQMGSPYLMGIGLGRPVGDAVATRTLPKPGKYRLWARTNDWVPEHHPGRFQIVVDGQPADHVFGESGVGVWPYGEQDPLDPRETGLVEEVRGEGVQRTEEAKANHAHQSAGQATDRRSLPPARHVLVRRRRGSLD